MAIHRNIRLLAWFNFCIDFRPYSPVAILYFTQVSGSFALGMSVFAVTSLAASAFEVPTGIYSDRAGRKRTIVLGAVASAASIALYALGSTFGYGLLIAGAVAEGLSRSFFSGNNNALLHDSLAQSGQEQEFQEFLGKTASMFQIALAISAILGSVIAAISFEAVMWLSVLPQAIGIMIALAMVEPKMQHERSGNIYMHLRSAFQNLIGNPKLRVLSAASILNFAIGEAAFQFRAAFIETLWPVWAIGIARTLSNIGAAFSFYFAGRIIRRVGEFPLLIGGAALSETINFIALLSSSIISPALMSLTSIFFGVTNVATGGLIQREFTPAERATMGSLLSFAGSLLFAVSSFGLGLLADAIGAANALIVATLLMSVPIMLYGRTFRHSYH